MIGVVSTAYLVCNLLLLSTLSSKGSRINPWISLVVLVAWIGLNSWDFRCHKVTQKHQRNSLATLINGTRCVLVFVQNQIDNPASSNMRPVATAVADYLVIVATGIQQCIGENGQSVEGKVFVKSSR